MERRQAGGFRRASSRKHRSEEEGVHTSKRARRAATGQSATHVSLLNSLPVELLYSIHIFARNPALALVSKHVHGALQACPTSVKVQYLLARWHEAYCYGFPERAVAEENHRDMQSRRKGQTSSQDVSRNGSPALPTQPSADLLDGGALPELAWNSRFLPVLPASDFPYPLSMSFQRSASAFVLDYCLRYRLTSLEVLHAVERRVLQSSEFGNIVQATGLWLDDDSNLHTHATPLRRQHEEGKRGEGAAGASKSQDAGEHSAIPMPSRLRITTLPRRVFQMRAEPLPLEEATWSPLVRLFHAFSPAGPLPDDAALAIILATAVLHVPSSVATPATSAPFNSYDGLPLAKVVFLQSSGLVQFLLAHGAEPHRKDNMCVYVAIQAGTIEILKMLVERDDATIKAWHKTVWRIRADFAAFLADTSLAGHDAFNRFVQRRDDQDRAASVVSWTRLPMDQAPAKRRKLCDRVNVNHKMMLRAVQYKQFEVANWLREKGVVADLKTMHLVEKMAEEAKSKESISGKSVQ